MPKLIKPEHKHWFDPNKEPYKRTDAYLAYQSLVWQCRYSGIEVPDALWDCSNFGIGKFYADDQADDMAQEADGLKRFDAWIDRFVTHVSEKGPMPNIVEDERAARTTTNTGK